MVTTRTATAGGTLSGNCLSRFSPAFGKEGGWVRSFKLLTVGGERLVCTPPADDGRPRTWTLPERAYMAAIGGLGYVGAVYEITYTLVRACDPSLGGRLAVKTTLTKHKTCEHLAAQLVAEAATACGPDGAPPAAHRASYSGLVRRMNGTQSAIVMTSTYTTHTDRRTLAIHAPDSALRFVSELLLRTRVGWLLSLFGYHVLFREGRTYVDDLQGFTFFMDGNVRCKAWGKRHGLRMPTVQQTFVVPFHPAAHGGCDEEAQAPSCRKLAAWLDESHAVLRRHKLTPTFSDVLFVRDTKPFDLSSNAGKAGFAASYAFETNRDATLERVERALTELAALLADERYDGRVYLVKNVYASQAVLRSMYGENALRLLRLKRRLDPDRLLVNAFFERTFGDLADEVYAGAHGEELPS